ncbi:MAG: N-formylglutamate amidohydrolase [Planctomycetes bacterium]|nr:N-formylglutamate amidohydrolase [Planctomycetota bacterium]MCC7171578.1 N-formylglutamate amidohydrolase [Planctomycetota bacterium]
MNRARVAQASARSAPRTALVVTCEHASARVPITLRKRFAGARELLASHRGYDAGALELARRLAAVLRAPMLATTVTRLVVDTNRSLRHPRLFSEFTRDLDPAAARAVIERHWRRHRERVAAALEHARRRSGRVVHVACHSFTPVLDGVTRRVDLGVLFDPRRRFERRIATQLRHALEARLPGVRIRFNQPYRGVSDGLTTATRRGLADRVYAGIELELNQAVAARPSRERVRWFVAITEALAETLAVV